MSCGKLSRLKICVVLFSSIRQMLEYNLTLCKDSFLPHPFQFIIPKTFSSVTSEILKTSVSKYETEGKCGICKVAKSIYIIQYRINKLRYSHHHHHHHHHHHKHQGLDSLIRSVSRVTTAFANSSSVFQLFSFLVVCSDMISKGFGLVALFASVKASSVCIHLSCLVCNQSVVHGVRSRLFCGHKGCSLLEVSITSFLQLQFFVSVRLPESNFLTHIKM